jgi:hypothetical protein
MKNEGEREIRLSTEELEKLLKKVKLIAPNEALYEARIEPGELVVKIIRE